MSGRTASSARSGSKAEADGRPLGELHANPAIPATPKGGGDGEEVSISASEMTPDEVVTACREAGVRLVRFLYCDNGGVIRGKATHIAGLARRMTEGMALNLALQAMNSLDQLQAVEEMGCVGELRLMPDPTTFTVLPYAPNTAAMLVDHVRLDGAPYEAGPRNFLKRMSECLADHEMVLLCAVENEFSLARRVEGGFLPMDEGLANSTVRMTNAQDVIDGIVEALEKQGIQVEEYLPELGHGQQELSVTPRPALQAADTQVIVRDTIRGVATRFGLVASLAPKPWPDQAGNGAHIHFSLWDAARERNLFHDPSGRFGLSSTAERFIAGILTHLPGLLGLTAPSFNSYQRFQPRHWSSAFVCWGPDNREAAIRVPSTHRGRENASTNLEYKPTDASCNPYLALGGLIAAGLDGIERELEPPAPVEVDPATLLDEERRRNRVERFPATLDVALEQLAADSVLRDALGDLLARSYLAVRRSEWEAYSQADEVFRFRNHFLKY
jgi:glutamine synthetase